MVGMDVGGEERAVCERFVEVGAMLDARRMQELRGLGAGARG